MYFTHLLFSIKKSVSRKSTCTPPPIPPKNIKIKIRTPHKLFCFNYWKTTLYKCKKRMHFFYFDISVTKKENNTLLRAKVRATVHNGCTAPDDCTFKRPKFFSYSSSVHIFFSWWCYEYYRTDMHIVFRAGLFPVTINKP